MSADRTVPMGRHADAARGSSDELARRWLREGKVWLLPLLLSDYGRDIIERKYDAIATDRAYENRPSGRFGRSESWSIGSCSGRRITSAYANGWGWLSTT